MKHAVTTLLVAAMPLIAIAEEKPNPFLSAPVYGQTHFNAAQTDAFPYEVKRGTFHADLTKAPRIPGGPINIQPVAAAKPGFMWVVSTDRASYVDARDGGWKALAEMGLPGVERRTEAMLNKLLDPKYETVEQLAKLTVEVLGEHPISITNSGLYIVADKDNVVYVNGGTKIFAIGLKDEANPSAGLEVKRSIDMAGLLKPMVVAAGWAPSVRLIGMSMTYDGHLVIGAQNAITVVDRMFTKPIVHYLEEGHMLKDSFSVDENNGIYVATSNLQPKGDGLMRKLVWTGKGISTDEKDGAWSSPYDGGDYPPSVKGGTGTGSTPTLMGFEKDKDRLVVITDGSNRYKLVAFWRDQIPDNFKQKPGTKSRRIAGQLQLTAGLPESTEWVQSEQSVVVDGWGAFVVNNMVPKGHDDKFIDVLINGPVTEPPHGMERAEWDPAKHEWKSVWTRGDVVSTSMVPVVSIPSDIVFVNGYSKLDGWEVTGLDWNTGKVVHRTIFGHSNLGNGAYAILQFAENGDLIFNSVGGSARVALKEQ